MLHANQNSLTLNNQLPSSGKRRPQSSTREARAKRARHGRDFDVNVPYDKNPDAFLVKGTLSPSNFIWPYKIHFTSSL